MISVKFIEMSEEQEIAFQIRHRVFVLDQGVPAEHERDAHDSVSHHALAFLDGVPCGTARWRLTVNGVKFERFAVLPEYRGQGVGGLLVQALLADVAKVPELNDFPRYLHAQLSAVPLYKKYGFEPEGDRFLEAGILHYKMVL